MSAGGKTPPLIWGGSHGYSPGKVDNAAASGKTKMGSTGVETIETQRAAGKAVYLGSTNANGSGSNDFYGAPRLSNDAQGRIWATHKAGGGVAGPTSFPVKPGSFVPPHIDTAFKAAFPAAAHVSAPDSPRLNPTNTPSTPAAPLSPTPARNPRPARHQGSAQSASAPTAPPSFPSTPSQQQQPFTALQQPSVSNAPKAVTGRGNISLPSPSVFASAPARSQLRETHSLGANASPFSGISSPVVPGAAQPASAIGQPARSHPPQAKGKATTRDTI